jgi:hypothetical protein
MKTILALILSLLATSAMANPSCMTQREARASYGDQWIYWHTQYHCWDNHRGRRVRIAKEIRVPLPTPRPLQYAPTEFELRFMGQ